MQVLVVTALVALLLASVPLVNYIRKCLQARQVLSHIPGISSWHFLFSGVDNKSQTPVNFNTDWTVLKRARIYLAQKFGLKEEEMKFWRMTLGYHNFVVTK